MQHLSTLSFLCPGISVESKGTPVTSSTRKGKYPVWASLIYLKANTKR
ncbi:hypothetical protein ABH944_005202 [Caballeronia udeis]|uniref:Uncharacterized protein n=1 Tax=Caballeronia udeis TaxID=1232866 RepID=A0ABW8MRL3_9BURK